MEWLRGHQAEVLFAQVSKACSGEQATSNSISMGWIGSVTPRPVLPVRWCSRPAAGTGPRLPPDLLQVLPHGGDPFVVEPVEPAGPLGPIGYQAGILEQAQVPGHGGPADPVGERLGEFADRPVAGAEQLHDRPAVRVPEGVERVSGQGLQRHCHRVTELLP